MLRMQPSLLALTALFAAGTGAAADSTLADLIQNGERAAALEAINGGADVNAVQGDGTTPLHWAVYKVDPELVTALIKRGAHTKVTNKYGSSPLAEAVKLANAKLVTLLLDAGADPESPNADGQTALLIAARVGALDVAKLLVAHGANVNTEEAWRGQTALMWAADGNYPELVQFLIDKGANVHTRAVTNDWRAQITSEPRAQYRPTGGLTPLLYAVRSGCSRCVRSMLAAGADVNQPNPDGVTPLIVAIDNFHYDTARLLLESGANPHVSDWWGRTALYAAVDMASYNQRGAQRSQTSETSAHDVVRLLLEAKVNANSQLNMHRPGRGGNSSRFVDDLLTTGATPLLRAAIGHDTESVRLLLDHGALADLPNVMGVTPLMGAAGMGISPRDRRLNLDDADVQARAVATLELLAAAGADVNARVTDIAGRTARIARISSMTERDGQTALYGAVKFGWAHVVGFLLAHGAKTDVKDASGKTPLDAALGKTGGRDNVVSDDVAALLKRGTVAAR